MTRLKTTMLCLIALLTFTTASSFGLAYTVNGHVECSVTGRVPYGALFKVYEVDPMPGGAFTVDEITLTDAAVVNVNGDFTITFANPIGSGGFEAGGPDLIFVLLQNINGTLETIYQEIPAETHWNVADGSSLSFQITSPLGVFYPPGGSNVPNNNLFLFTRVGNHLVDNIDCKVSEASSQGYYKPRRVPYSYSGMDSDMPYGSTLDLFGWFGQTCEIDYYQVLYLPPGEADVPANWVAINTNLPNKWYNTSTQSPFDYNWVSESMGPFSDGGIDNLYTIPFKVRPGVPWSYIDRLACFDTRLVANGLCQIKVIGYKRVGTNVIEATSSDITIDVNYGQIKLQIDNTQPMVQITALRLNGVPYNVCQILQFGNNHNDTISLDFQVWDQRGHLREYGLAAMYGHNQSVATTPSTPDKAVDDYSSHGFPLWQGAMSYTTTYAGDVYTPAKMPTCAYQFRLRASKRTTDGYGLIHNGVEDTWHVTIQR